MSYQKADTNSQRQMRMIRDSAEQQGRDPDRTVCVLDPEVEGGTAYFPPPLIRGHRGGSDSHRGEGAELWRAERREKGTSSRHIHQAPFAAQAPGCVSSLLILHYF